ncbi:MAG: putative transport system permease protein, partial [Solirubrobacteraceae bacterium]|nr:putative transport system permease protein [Solirubrobacteraceae bacterium]
MSIARLALAGMVRAPSRTLTRIVVLAAATALLGSMLLFVGNSLRTMSAGAVRDVPLDWQGPVSSYDQARGVARGVAAQRGVLQASPTATAPFAGASGTGPAGATSSASGAVLAVPPDYGRHLATFRILQGALQPGAVVLDQQMAATLQARIGGTVALKPSPRARAVPYRVSGIAVVSQADKLFAPLNPQAGPAPAQPPANVAILPLETFAHTYARALRALTPSNVGSSAQPGAQDGVQWQVQA